MKEIIVQDDGGADMTFWEHNGGTFPKFEEPHGIEDIDAVKIREDDVMITSFPKSGTHWTLEIARELVLGKTNAENVAGFKFLIEMTPKDVLEQRPAPRFLCTHVHFADLPPEVKEKKQKIINVVRNPKDIATSYFPFLNKMPGVSYKGKWENFLRPFVKGKFVYGSWFDYMRSWDKAKTDNPDFPILTLYYEDMKEDLMREMRRICTFLNLDRSDEFLSEVMQHTSIQNMKSKLGEKEQPFFRKGGIGDWKNWFTVAENEWFDKIYQEETKDIELAKHIRFINI